MELLRHLLDFFLHLDKHLADILRDYGTLTYAILFLIIFVETGLVIMPFLPGDSLLFAAGALAASTGALNPWLLLVGLVAAAFLGDTLNYFIGKYLGAKVFTQNYRFLKKEYLLAAQAFYEKHGGKAIIFARFIPFVRTFAPFVAGVSTMHYGKFVTYNFIGGLLWVSSFLAIGYFFGSIPVIKQNFTLVVFGIILLSVLPPVIEVLRARRRPV